MLLVDGSCNDVIKRGFLRYGVLKGAAVRRLATNNAMSSGMTLIELLVAVGVTTIIMALSTLIFMSQYKSYRTSHAVKSTETDIQKAVEFVRDDMTLAGWGVKPQMAFFFVDGGANRPDQVYVSDISLMDANNTKQMRVLIDSGPTECGGCRRYVDSTADTTDNPCSNSTKTYLIYDINCNGDEKELKAPSGKRLPVLVWAQGSNATRVRETDDSGNLLNAGAGEKYVTPAVRYSVDNSTTAAPSLLRWARDTSGAQPMAEGVVDLQVIYGDNSTIPALTSDYLGNGIPMNGTRYGRAGCTSGTNCQMDSFDSSRISWVNLYVVTRSAERTNDPASCRPAIANRGAGNATTCGYAYRVYVSRIMPLRRVH